MNEAVRNGSRPGTPRAETTIAGFLPEILDDVCADLPLRLYLRGDDGAMHLIVHVAFEPDAHDPWTAELRSAALWETAPDRLTALRALPRRDRLPVPDPDLRLLAIRPGGALAGGLLVRAPATRATALARKLSNRSVRASLGLLLTFGGSRREMESLRAFREGIAAALPYAVLVVDPLGRIVWAGARTTTILGVRPEEAIGSDCARLLRPVAQELNPLLEALKGRFRAGEAYIARGDGEEVPVSIVTAPLPGPAGRRRGIIALVEDLSDERLHEEAERQRDRLAALGELSAGVAHEIRNPLTGIANCAQVLQEGMDETDTRQRFLRIILDEAARLNRIVEGLLRYARPNRPELREASIEEVARRAADLLRPDLDAQGIRLGFRVTGRIPRVYIDPGQIEQVLINLLRNAQEAMPSGGEVGIQISVVRRRPHRRRSPGRRAGDRVRIRPGGDGPLVRFVSVRVTDSGHGIPRELLPRIFNPFYTTRKRGTGLGLSLSQSIVREHGGYLTVRSVLNKGTVFHLDLPVERRQGDRRKD